MCNCTHSQRLERPRLTLWIILNARPLWKRAKFHTITYCYPSPIRFEWLPQEFPHSTPIPPVKSTCTGAKCYHIILVSRTFDIIIIQDVRLFCVDCFRSENRSHRAPRFSLTPQKQGFMRAFDLTSESLFLRYRLFPRSTIPNTDVVRTTRMYFTWRRVDSWGSFSPFSSSWERLILGTWVTLVLLWMVPKSREVKGKKTVVEWTGLITHSDH